MTPEALTDEERDFAEQHHDIVYKFLRARRLPADEYYDVVIFGYLEAVQRNFRVAVDPERRNFSALANICMKTAVCREIRFRSKDMRKANYAAVSMDCPLSDDKSLSLHDILPDEMSNVMAETENRDLISRALSVATAREYEVLAYLCSGFSMAEISQITGINIHTARAASSGLHQKTRLIKNGNPPEKTAQQRYYEAHKGEYAKRNTVYQKTHKAEIRARQRFYQAAHKDEINARNRARYAAKKAASDDANIENGSTPPTRANQEGSGTASIPIPPLKSK